MVDVLGCGLPVIAFDVASFKEIGISEPYLVSSPSSFKDIVYQVSISDHAVENDHYQDIAHQYNAPRVATSFMKILRELI